ncbi:MAG: hypothetical protein GY839_12820 [candidate division Zixibacteria bacterium]|nr:hypothetical protein [candidate division Zixibacteria bacterium]
MLKLFLILIVLCLSPLARSQLTDTRNFIAGAELGIFLADFGSNPMAILPGDLNSHDFIPISLWGKLGYRFKELRVMSKFKYWNPSKPFTEEEEHLNLSELFITAMVIEAEFYTTNRLTLAGNSGYQYSYFRAYPTNDKQMQYKHEDNGPLLGFSSRYLFKKPSSDKDKALFFGDNLSMEFSYKHGFAKHPTNNFRLSLYTLYKKMHFFIRIRYMDQNDDYGLYALTIGGDGFWGF